MFVMLEDIYNIAYIFIYLVFYGVIVYADHSFFWRSLPDG